ncbi:kinase-like domain-containing protein, partial [Powellomyces hirtus]
MATSQQQHAPSARKGVRWDEVQVQEQQKEASERHAGPAMTPYAVFATPKDWKTPPVAAYPYMNRYRLIGKMGEGAFSTVYRAIDSKTNLLVALKLVSKNQLNDTQRNNILRETTLLRRIKHGNIIRLVDFHETPLHYALALELMSGGEIFHQLVSQVCFSEPVCRHVIGQVAEGLRYLHEELGVVHRDIKLENLLYEPIPPNATGKRPEGLGPNVEDDYIPGVGGAGIGLVKIADFGLSKVVFNATTKTPCGTVGYTAPEILNDQRYSKGVDMWALGCVLYTILSGFPPFFDDDPRGLTEKVANGQFAFLSPWWDDISSEAKDLICHLLQVNPKKRYTISQFLAHPWMQGDTVAPA